MKTMRIVGWLLVILFIMFFCILAKQAGLPIW